MLLRTTTTTTTTTPTTPTMRRPSWSICWASFTLACLALTSGWLAGDADAANRSSDDWKRLAERALGQDPGTSVTIRPGIVEPALRSALPPIPKSWKTLGTIDRTFGVAVPTGSASAPKMSQVYFDVPNTAYATLDQWHERFLAAGWTEQAPSPTNGSVPATAPSFRSYCRADRGIAVRRTSFGSTTTVIVFDPSGPCRRATEPPQLTEIINAMRPPKLSFPASVVVLNQKPGTGSPIADSADLTLRTSTSVGELNTLAAAQMAANGWTNDDTATAPSIVISRWRKDAGGATIAAFLYVSTAPGPDRRTVSITTWNKAFASDLTFTGDVFAPSGPVTTKVP